ncbi:hypothetical protein DFH11DRAFT_1742815 [Phellopilus nigrolimitatus]|nr:hypothetical protein DFH11DRAFT_1742815 [Phellopilus nigrolimitatus]
MHEVQPLHKPALLFLLIFLLLVVGFLGLKLDTHLRDLPQDGAQRAANVPRARRQNVRKAIRRNKAKERLRRVVSWVSAAGFEREFCLSYSKHTKVEKNDVASPFQRKELLPALPTPRHRVAQRGANVPARTRPHPPHLRHAVLETDEYLCARWTDMIVLHLAWDERDKKPSKDLQMTRVFYESRLLPETNPK